MKRYDTPKAWESTTGPYMAYADHAAFVARVREIARSVSHHPNCTWHHTEFCNCPRGQLLEVLNG